MGSIPILTETPPLSSSVGRALQHKAHLVILRDGAVGSSSGSLPEGHWFESNSRTQILRRWSKGSSLGSLPRDNVRIVRAQPTTDSKTWAVDPSALTRICKLNYHFPLEELSLVTSCGVCGLAENAI